jgi:hypothetical protein
MKKGEVIRILKSHRKELEEHFNCILPVLVWICGARRSECGQRRRFAC